VFCDRRQEIDALVIVLCLVVRREETFHLADLVCLQNVQTHVAV
jgi:hypothetical protein